ncbi:MAG: C40 family peptidase [Arachidicoccus sp.]|nr:C40 family peptidase [Arachidicoccus sp.]
MQKVISIVPAAPLRAESFHRSEMVSELLFGETAKVLEVDKNFIKIKTDLNHYEGWIQYSQITEIKDTEPLKILGYAYEEGNILFNNLPMRISIGTPVFDIKNIGKYTVDYSNIEYKKLIVFSEDEIKNIAFKFINTSYLWGGRSSFGIDCSGFAQLVYSFFGVYLPRDTYQQATIGETIDYLDQSKCGDLAYFDNEDGRIIHVGIILNKENIIHSSGKVRIDKIDAQGIVNVDNGERTHKLRIIKRVV